MKILVVCQYYYPENFIITNIAEELAKRGHEVDVLTGKPNYGYGYILPEYAKKGIIEQTVNGVHVIRVDISPRKKSRLSIILNYLSFWNNSKKWVKKTNNKYDAVYSLSLSPVTICSAGNLYKKIHHVKHIIHCVDLWPESVLVTKAVKPNSHAYKILYKWSRDIYQEADKILVGSPSFSQYFSEILKLHAENIHFVPQPSIIEEVPQAPIEYKHDSTNILYCGNLGLIQLIPLIAETMKIVEDKNIFFHVIGMGPLSKTLEEKIKEYRLENNLIYHGPIIAKEAVRYFVNADAIYISLSNEGYVGKTIPNKLMMALAMGKPIIGVLDGDGKNIIIESGAGFIADPNPESVKNAIIAISKLNKKELSKMGQLAKSYYDANFSTEFVTSQIEKLLIE